MTRSLYKYSVSASQQNRQYIMWNRWLLVFAIVCCGLQCVVGYRKFRVAPMYTNNMMLQMAPKRSQIWGSGSEQFAEIVLTLNGRNYYTTVRSNWTWSIQLPPHPAGGPHTVTVTQNSFTSFGPASVIEITNVMFGDVWLCAGEQNMEFPLSWALNATATINRAIEYSDRIKIVKTRNMNSEMILDWETLVTRSDTVREFSAVCLMYGMALADALDDGRPIGLIQTTVLGSPIESWVSPDTILKCNTPESPPFSSKFHIYKTSNNQQWNEFILPLTKISIRGMIWSQGESNLDYNPELYVCHLHNFMKDVSSRFFDATVPVPHENNISFPFGVVQAGPMNNDRPDVWGDLRWSQSLGNYLGLYSWLKGKFFVSTYDLTDNSPARALYRDKQTVATRLANSVTNMLYKHERFNSKVGGPRAYASRDESKGVVLVKYDRNVSIVGTQGFQYRVTGDEWRSVTDIRMVSARNLEVAVPADADTLAYAWSATVCTKYRDCAIYSDDEDALPAMPWLWRLSDSEKIRREKKYIVHGTYFVQYPSSNKTKVSIGDWSEYY